jgi:hypothetical protein
MSEPVRPAVGLVLKTGVAVPMCKSIHKKEQQNE